METDTRRRCGRQRNSLGPGPDTIDDKLKPEASSGSQLLQMASLVRHPRALVSWFVIVVAVGALINPLALSDASGASYQSAKGRLSPASSAHSASNLGDLSRKHRHPQHQTLLFDLDGIRYDWATVATQYQAIVLNDWQGPWASAIKAVSPGTRVYVYKDLSSTRSDDCGSAPGGGSPCIVNGVFCPAGTNDASYYAGGVGFCWAWRNHPDWFVRGFGGDLIQYAGYPGTFMMDFGNPSYQAQWLANVKVDVASQGWDGVSMDNAIDYTNYGTPASYPTPAALQAATLSMLKVVGPGLTGAGTMNIANLGYNNLFPNLWVSWLPYVGGLIDESSYYWPGSSTPQSARYWSSFLEPSVQACANQHKVCIFNIGGGSLTQAQKDFGLGSILLYTNGNSYVSYGKGGLQGITTALGAATDTAYETPDGVWHRHFVRGSVSVNPAAGIGTITGVP
jgi:hypothetical protein